MYGKDWEFRDRFIEGCVEIEEGQATLICKQGIGVKYDESLLEQYIITK